ncbi:MAG: hypothetical protein O6928_04160, partial [Gammaproteobacteria bacterium]|nr:hypothetical protein [Gammaproteobacteria bacterium]
MSTTAWTSVPLWGVRDDSMEGGGRERLEHLPRSESLRVRYAIGLVQTVLLLETLKPLPNMCFGLIS